MKDQDGYYYDLSLMPEGETLDSILKYYNQTGLVRILQDGKVVEINPKQGDNSTLTNG